MAAPQYGPALPSWPRRRSAGSATTESLGFSGPGVPVAGELFDRAPAAASSGAGEARGVGSRMSGWWSLMANCPEVGIAYRRDLAGGCGGHPGGVPGQPATSCSASWPIPVPWRW